MKEICQQVINKINGRLVFDRLTEAGILAGVFFFPLIFSFFQQTYSVFEFNKFIFLRADLAFLFLFTAIREIFFPSALICRLRYFFKKYLAIPFVFIAGFGLTVIFSDNIALSFFGSYSRQQGYLSYLIYFFWFILVAFNLIVLKEREGRKPITRFIAAMAISGVIVSLYAVLQILALDPYDWAEKPYITGRAFSTLAQPNFLASWLLLVVPLYVCLFFESKKLAGRVFYLLALILSLFALFFSGSRAGLLGLIFAFFCGLVYVLKKNLRSKKERLIVASAALALTVFSLFLFNLAFPGRIADIFDFASGSTNARFSYYSAALSTISHQPILGHGSENLQQAFFPFYNSEWNFNSAIGQIPDRAHNIFLDLLMSGGIVLLFSFLLIYYFFFHLAKQNIAAGRESTWSLAIAIAVAAYFFSLLFGFAIPSGELYFFSFLAILVAISYQAPLASTCELVKKKTSRLSYLLLLLTVLISSFLFYRAISYYRADYHFSRSIKYFQTGRVVEALEALGHSERLGPNPINRSVYGYAASPYILEYYLTSNNLSLRNLLRDRLEYYQSSLIDKNAFDLIARARVGMALGQQNESYAIISRLKSESPSWPNSYLEEAISLRREGKYAEAAEAYLSLLSLLPDGNDGRATGRHGDEIINYRSFVNSELADTYIEKNNQLNSISK